MSAVKISSKGQIVLPKQIRAELGIGEGSRLEVRCRAGEIVLLPLVDAEPATDWRSWRGSLAGSRALEEHLREHEEEIQRERLP